MSKDLTQLSHCALSANKQKCIAVYKGQVIEHSRFVAEVKQLAGSLSTLTEQNFALYYEQAYPFCVSLFALLHSNKKVYIAANNKAVTAQRLIDQQCVLLGDWNDKQLIVMEQKTDFQLLPLDLNRSGLTIYTSGSTGQAKAIDKTLQQFQTEIETLEQYWGDTLASAQVLATVSHQHIYGLLFRVLWPLVAERCFHSEMYLSPEPLLKVAKNITAYWVASPAQLKRLDERTLWPELASLKAIFSSGGMLSIEAAKQVANQCGHKVIEVYGSSETGGIAWRQSVDKVSWTLFNGICITIDEQGRGLLKSPYLATNQDFMMDDKIQLQENSQFTLLGRSDRIVKIEEKRLSLDELELALNNLSWIKQSYTLLLADKRDKIVATIVLTDKGDDYLQQHGRAPLIKQLRKQLMQQFETVVLPKKWLIMDALPLTPQGKINRELLFQLFSLDPLRYPVIQHCQFQSDAVELQCKVPANLVYFAGHFPAQPILPGVTQLAWAEQLAKIFFDIDLPFLRMEVIKFKKIIQPEAIISICLSWKSEAGKLYFEIHSDSDSHSSGRIVYGESE